MKLDVFATTVAHGEAVAEHKRIPALRRFPDCGHSDTQGCMLAASSASSAVQMTATVTYLKLYSLCTSRGY